MASTTPKLRQKKQEPKLEEAIPHVNTLPEEEVAILRRWALASLKEKIGVDYTGKPNGSSSSSISPMGILLKALGIKKGSIRLNNASLPSFSESSNSASLTQVFGTPLEQLLLRAPSHTGPQRLKIPSPVHTMLKYLRREDRIEIDGLFRIPGSSKRMAEVEMAFNAKLDIDLETFTPQSGVLNCHDVAGLLKHFLRSLPEPLLTGQFEKVCVAVEKLDSGSEQIIALQLFYLSLPSPNRDLFESLLRFLHRVARRQNKMDATNLALVFTPSFIPPESLSNMNVHGDVVATLRTFITRSEDIFKLNIWLAVRDEVMCVEGIKGELSASVTNFARLLASRPSLGQQAKSLTRSLSNIIKRGNSIKRSSSLKQSHGSIIASNEVSKKDGLSEMQQEPSEKLIPSKDFSAPSVVITKGIEPDEPLILLRTQSIERLGQQQRRTHQKSRSHIDTSAIAFTTSASINQNSHSPVSNLEQGEHVDSLLAEQHQRTLKKPSAKNEQAQRDEYGKEKESAKHEKNKTAVSNIAKSAEASPAPARPAPKLSSQKSATLASSTPSVSVNLAIDQPTQSPHLSHFPAASPALRMHGWQQYDITDSIASQHLRENITNEQKQTGSKPTRSPPTVTPHLKRKSHTEKLA